MDQHHAQAFGRYLKERRQALRLTTRALAALAGVNQATVVRLEAGAIAEPRADKLRRIAEALELRPTETFALAGYARAHDLPALRVYLQSTHPELTRADIDEVDAHVSDLLRRRLKQQTTAVVGLVADEVTT